MKKSVVLIPIGLLLCGCAAPNSSEPTPKSDAVKIIVEEGQHFTPEQAVYSVHRGQEATIKLRFDAKYSCKGVDYEGAIITAFDDGAVEIHLPPVYYSTRLRVEEMELKHTSTLHLNGGSFREGKGTGEEYRLVLDDSHIRPVLPAGVDVIKRDGYALIGWNTKEDASGVEVGLGSRYDLGDWDELPDFYAHWVEETSFSDFRFSIVDNTVRIDEYKGEKKRDRVVIPASVGNYPVTQIKTNAFYDLEVDEFVLPLSMVEVGEGAFFRSKIGSLYFYDNLEGIHDNCFNESTVAAPRILLHEPVRGVRWNSNTQFAESMDRLWAGRGKKKLIYFSGCSGAFSVDSSRIEEELGGEYYPINFGILGDTNATVMWDCILSGLEPGDLLIHAPEQMSVYSMLNDISCDSMFFQLYGGNFDLLRDVDPMSLPKFFDAFSAYVGIQKHEPQGTYSDRPKWYTEYGDCCMPRPNSSEHADFGIVGVWGIEFFDTPTVDRLNHYYDEVRKKGATPVFSYAPLNANAVNRLDPDRTDRAKFDDIVRRYLDIEVISDIASCELPGQFFYDTDYHTSEEGQQERTTRLIADLKACLS